MGEGLRGGPRLRQILERLAPLREALVPIVRQLRRSGALEGFDVDELLLYVLLAGTGRFALDGLTQELTGRTTTSPRAAERQADRQADRQAERQADRHAERLLAFLH